MTISIRKTLTLLMIWCCLCGSAQASHDNGQGKSQDGGHGQDEHELGSVAVAPEPSTLLIFLLGSLGLAAAFRQNSTKHLPKDH